MSLMVGAVVALAYREPAHRRTIRRQQTDGDASSATVRLVRPGPRGGRATASDPDAEPDPAPEEDLELEEISEERPCPDIAEPGDRALMLRLFNPETTALVSGRVHLWRLGLSETENWTAGDRLRVTVEVPRDGIVLENLPAGRYRVDADDHPLSATAPPEFELRAEYTGKEVAVRRLLSFRVTLRMRDHTGRPLAGRGFMHVPTRYRPLAPPPWAKPRERKHPVEQPITHFHGDGESVSLGPDPLAFVVPERTRLGSGEWSCSIWSSGMSSLSLRIDEIDRERHYVAPCVPLTLLRSSIGASPDAPIRATALIDPDIDWRDIPITIEWGKRRYIYTVRGGSAVRK